MGNHTFGSVQRGWIIENSIWIYILMLTFYSVNSRAYSCDAKSINYGNWGDDREFIGCRITFSNVSINNGADIRVVAHQKIVLDPGVHAYTGSNLHISLDNDVVKFVAARGSDEDWGTDEFLQGAQDNGWPNADFGLIAEHSIWAYDSTIVTEGQDTDETNGWDHAMAMFIGAHGAEPYVMLDVALPADLIYIYDMEQRALLGNFDNGGMLRYFFVNSCGVFKHGPRWDPASCNTPEHEPYKWPELFNGLPTNHLDVDHPCLTHANIYETIGPIMDDSMRMACGITNSSRVANTMPEYFWEYMDDNGDNRSIAEAWALANRDIEGSMVPICITKGAEDYNQTPLVLDGEFRTQNNNPTEEKTHYYIKWLKSYSTTNWGNDDFPTSSISYQTQNSVTNVKESNTEWFDWSTIDTYQTIENSNYYIPDKLPIIEIDQDKMNYDSNNAYDIFERNALTKIFKDKGATKIVVNKKSNAVFVDGVRKIIDENDNVLNDDEYINIAWTTISDLGLNEIDVSSKVVFNKLNVQKAPIIKNENLNLTKSPAKITNFQDKVIIEFKRQLVIDGGAFEITGQGGVIRVDLNNDSSMGKIAKIWRPIKEIKKENYLPVKSIAIALKEAEGKMTSPHQYRLIKWKIGYKEESSKIVQKQMIPVYVFYFEGVDNEIKENFKEVEITAI